MGNNGNKKKIGYKYFIIPIIVVASAALTVGWLIFSNPGRNPADGSTGDSNIYTANDDDGTDADKPADMLPEQVASTASPVVPLESLLPESPVPETPLPDNSTLPENRPTDKPLTEDSGGTDRYRCFSWGSGYRLIQQRRNRVQRYYCGSTALYDRCKWIFYV